MRIIMINVNSVSGLQGLKSFDKDPGRRGLQLREFILNFQDSISAVERCPFPVIAAVHGVAIGLSIDINTACDVRYGTSNARFSVKVHVLDSHRKRVL